MAVNRPFKVGDVIIEKHPQAAERVIRHIVEGQGISCTGVASGRTNAHCVEERAAVRTRAVAFQSGAAVVTDSALADLIFRTDYVTITDIEGWFSTLRAIRELPEVQS